MERTRRNLPPILVLLLGVVLSSIAFFVTHQRQQSYWRFECERVALATASRVRDLVDGVLVGVSVFQGLYAATEYVTREEFEAFSINLRRFETGANAYAWCPRVPGEERKRFVAETRAERGESFDLYDLDGRSRESPAAVRDDYFPVLFGSPLSQSASFEGLDLGSVPEWRRAILDARDTGSVRAAAVADRFGGVGCAPGCRFLVFSPIYRGHVAHDNVEWRQGAFEGLVVADMCVDSIIERVIDRTSPRGLDVYLIEPQDDGVSRVRFTSRGLDASDSARSYDAGQIVSSAVRAEPLTLGDRTWTLAFVDVDDPNSLAVLPYAILGLGLGLSLLLAAYIRALMSREGEVTQLVEYRTSQLESTRSQLEDEVRERQRAEQLLLDAVDKISQGIALFDADDRLVFFNRHFRDSLGPAKDIVGRTFHELMHEQISLRLIAEAEGQEEKWLRWRFAQHRTPTEPLEIQRRAEMWVRIVEHRLPDGGTFVVLTDITAERRQQEELRQAQRMEATGRLTGGIAHDFNNLLTVVMGNLDLLEPHLEDIGSLELLRDANLAARRGAELTQRLLAFSRRQPLRPEVTNVNQLVSRMTTLLQRSLGETIDVRTELSPDVRPILVDATQLETALLNLAVNARDAMPAGGHVVIATSNATLDRTDGERGAAPLGDCVLIRVTDDGEGMSRDVLDRVFEPFFTTKDVGRGSGLGLSMVYGFIKQSGGHIEIASHLGRGTTVELYLPPASSDSPTPSRVAHPAGRPRGRGERILIVEDDTSVREMLERTLTELGYEAIGTESARDGLMRLQEDPRPDLVLTDIVLPDGMNGFELAAEARRVSPGLRVLFMSGYTEEVIRGNTLLHDGSRLLTKPFRRGELANAIRDSFARTIV